jgi:hypothetical protein
MIRETKHCIFYNGYEECRPVTRDCCLIILYDLAEVLLKHLGCFYLLHMAPFIIDRGMESI